MKELKINPELRDFIPPLSGEEKSNLKTAYWNMDIRAHLYTYGMVTSLMDIIAMNYVKNTILNFLPKNLFLVMMQLLLMLWNGWLIHSLVDVIFLHNRELQLLKSSKKKSKNKQIPKKKNPISNFIGNRYTGKVDCSPNGEESKKDKYHTDKELAKLAGVGTGTIARYNRVMNSDDEELKKKVLADEVKINTAYEKVREKEKKKENINTEQSSSKPKTYQEAAKLYGGMQQGHLPNQKNNQNVNDEFTDEQLLNALISTKTPVNVLDSIIPKQEFDIMTNTLLENIESCDYRIFDLHEVCKKMENNDLDYAIEKFDSVITAIMELEEKIKKTVKGEN